MKLITKLETLLLTKNGNFNLPLLWSKRKTTIYFLSAADNPEGEPNYAYNLYQCECDAICKVNVWNTPGKLWIDPLSVNIKFIPK